MLLGERAAHPLSALLGVPNAARRDASPVSVALSHGNAYMGGATADESLRLDGETTRLSIDYRHRLDRCRALFAHTAVLHHGGGGFDAAIESWHDTFGLPNAGREDVPRDALSFSYRRRAGDGTEGPPELRSSTTALSDTHVGVQQAMGCGRAASARWVLRAALKLPTGQVSSWSGSGATDAWLDVQTPVLSPHPRWQLAASAGVLFAGTTEALPRGRSVIGFGAVGVRVRAHDRVALQAGIDWHSAPADSALVEIGAPAARLSVGFRIATSPHGRLDVQLLEDLHVDTATDVAVKIGWSLRR